MPPLALSAAKGPAGLDLSEYQAAVKRYDESIIDKIVGLIVEANSQLQPAHLLETVVKGESTSTAAFAPTAKILPPSDAIQKASSIAS